MSNKIELMTITKNNRPDDLKEWADYHLAIGFEKITIFNNDSLFSVKDLFKNNKKIVVIDTPGDYGIDGYRNQLVLANRFFNEKKNSKEMKWLGWFDDDEFLYIKNNDLDSVLAKNSLCISFVWKFMSLPTPIEKRSGTLIETFNYSRNKLSGNNFQIHIKTIVNLESVVQFDYNTINFPTAHLPQIGSIRHTSITGIGEQVGSESYDVTYTAEEFYNTLSEILYHYHDQSIEDRKFKISRGLDTIGYYDKDLDNYKNAIKEREYTILDNSMIERKKELGLQNKRNRIRWGFLRR